MSALESASRDPKQNTTPYILDAVNAGATVGDVRNLCRKVFGEYKERVVV